MSDPIKASSNDASESQISPLLGLTKDAITTVIDAGVRFEGKLSVTGGRALHIKGELIGSIESDGAVLIDESGQVSGSISAQSLQVSGRVFGADREDKVNVAGPVVLTKTARMVVNIEHGGMYASFGSEIEGFVKARRPAAAGASTAAAEAALVSATRQPEPADADSVVVSIHHHQAVA